MIFIKAFTNGSTSTLNSSEELQLQSTRKLLKIFTRVLEIPETLMKIPLNNNSVEHAIDFWLIDLLVEGVHMMDAGITMPEETNAINVENLSTLLNLSSQFANFAKDLHLSKRQNISSLT
jgi:hypothetical protein